MPSPVVLHLSRPYANADEYLAREAWSIDTRSMVLVGQGELPAETDIAFDVTLADGSKPIRAEAKVIGVAPAGEGRPGGLRVRFKRYGAATRAFVERAVAVRWSAGDGPTASVPPASVRPPASSPPREHTSSMPSPGARPSSMPSWEEDKTSRFSRATALAAPMTHQPSDAAPPSDRNVLLERLRKRARQTEGSSG